jgi:RimJ/RimL family protein N-acetyltransferase
MATTASAAHRSLRDAAADLFAGRKELAKSARSFPELATPRLRLRQFEPRDAAGLHACFGDVDAMRYWNFPPCRSMVETERWLRILAKTSSPYDYLAWAVAEKRSDHCIGMVNYHHREAHNRRLEVGYMLARSHYGRGLMTEAMRALIAYCFTELHVHRMEALIHPDNSNSIRLAERLGFRFEGGPLRDYWRLGERYISVVIYGLIRDDLILEQVDAARSSHRRAASGRDAMRSTPVLPVRPRDSGDPGQPKSGFPLARDRTGED